MDAALLQLEGFDKDDGAAVKFECYSAINCSLKNRFIIMSVIVQ